MAFQKSHKVKGFSYPEAYWRVGFYQFDRKLNQGHFIMQCYANKAAREESPANVIDERSAYPIKKQMNEIECYEYLLSVEDIMVGSDENGEAIMGSFFSDAKVV